VKEFVKDIKIDTGLFMARERRFWRARRGKAKSEENKNLCLNP